MVTLLKKEKQEKKLVQHSISTAHASKKFLI
jgi:hypothetical protein